MKIFPAIDIKNGAVVRLAQGRFEDETVYSGDPAGVAWGFYEQGARNIHVVDLDGAKDGKLANFDIIGEIAGIRGMFMEAGGGVRDEERIKAYLNAGVDRVILGTLAARDFEYTRRMIQKFGRAVAVGVDAADNRAAAQGWLEDSGIDAFELCRRYSDAGVSAIIYTDISKDGMLSGINAELYGRLADMLKCEVIASGGIAGMDDIAALKKTGVSGAILGKSIYSGALNLKDVLELADKTDNTMP